MIALALCGAVIGFAYFNRPVARLFLGDVGSLPIGFLLGWLLLLVAASGHLAAAIVMPLYYLADATITLLRRLFRGEPVWHAHRSHFYQLATDRGFTVIGVVAWVFAVNVALVRAGDTDRHLCQAEQRSRRAWPAALCWSRVSSLCFRPRHGNERHRIAMDSGRNCGTAAQAAAPLKSGTASRSTR